MIKPRSVESEKARLSLGACSDSDRHCPDAVLEIGGVFYHVRISGKAESLLEILRQWNGFCCVRTVLEHFGYTLADCYRNSPEQTFAFLKERYEKDIARFRENGNGTWVESRLNEWRWFLQQVDGLPPKICDLFKRACDELYESSARLAFAWLQDCDF